MKSHKRVRNMKSVHARRKGRTRERVLAALELLEREGAELSFALVARVAGVSRPTIYNHPELRAAVDRGIALQRDARRRLELKKSEDAATIKKLRADNAKLRRKNRWQADMIAVLKDTGPVIRDEDIVERL